MPSEEREKIVLHQLEELLRERTQDKVSHVIKCTLVFTYLYQKSIWAI